MKKIKKHVVLCLLLAAVFVLPVSAVRNKVETLENVFTSEGKL